MLTSKRPSNPVEASRRPLALLLVVSLCLLFVPLVFAVFGDSLVRAFFESPIRVLGPIVVLVPVYFFIVAVMHHRRSR